MKALWIQCHTHIFWFVFYSFQTIPACFLDCCYTPSWCPQTVHHIDSEILFLIVYLFHPASWAFVIFKFQPKFLIHFVELSSLFCNCLNPEQFAGIWKLWNVTWNHVIYDTKIIARYRPRLKPLWHFTGKIPPLWKLTIQSLSLFLTNWHPVRNPALLFLDSLNVFNSCWLIVFSKDFWKDFSNRWPSISCLDA